MKMAKCIAMVAMVIATMVLASASTWAQSNDTSGANGTGGHHHHHKDKGASQDNK
jgi:opacity protein-like surface antigen